MANLYELMRDYKALQEVSSDHELPSDRLDGVLSALEETRGSLEEKVDNICRLLANMSSDLEAYEVEIRRLQSRRDTLRAKQERLKSWMRTSMELLDVPKMQAGVFTVSISAGRSSVQVVDLDAVPDDFVKVERKVNKRAVLKVYGEDGECVPGTEVVAGEPVLRVS